MKHRWVCPIATLVIVVLGWILLRWTLGSHPVPGLASRYFSGPSYQGEANLGVSEELSIDWQKVPGGAEGKVWVEWEGLVEIPDGCSPSFFRKIADKTFSNNGLGKFSGEKCTHVIIH